MEYEIDFHRVGDASRAGDAITVRYGLNGHYQVMVIDGGTADCGAAVVAHIREIYGADTVISHAVSSHPDADHASGLRNIIEAFPVEHLWVHVPWAHASDMLPYFADKNLTGAALATAIRNEYPIVEELITLAGQHGAPVREPFQGATIGPFTVLSPREWAYTRLVPQFRRTPAPDVAKLRSENMWIEPRPVSVSGGLLAAAIAKVQAWVDERWDIELLREGAVTAAENETSTVLHGAFGNSSVLLTADAGVNALRWASEQATQFGIDLGKVDMIQVPHHGSRSNVTPSTLDQLLGPRLPPGSPQKRIAIVSVPKDDDKHPRKMVMNAFRRRGAPVYGTQSRWLRHHRGMPVRPSESPAQAFDLFAKVENYD